MENSKKKNKSSYFVKYPLCLTYLFSPGESRFIIHMIEIEFLKSQGYNTNWGKLEYMKRMGLNEYTFDRTVKKLSDMRLLHKTNNKLGNRVYYSLNMDVYERLVTILSSTSNIDKLISFCGSKFKKENRDIMSITEEDLQELKGGNGLTKNHFCRED